MDADKQYYSAYGMCCAISCNIKFSNLCSGKIDYSSGKPFSIPTAWNISIADIECL